MSERAEKRPHGEENGEDVVVAKQAKGENGKDKAEEKLETVKGNFLCRIYIYNFWDTMLFV